MDSKKKKGTKVPTVKKTNQLFSHKEYISTLDSLKKHIRECQSKAAISVNRELIKLYWDIGMTISEKQQKSGWGSNVIENLAKDLQNAFPGINGFSRSNIFHMRSFYNAYEKVQQAARQLDELPIFNIPWWHNVILLTKLKDTTQRLWYAQKTAEQGWTRSALEDWIESDLYSREGKAITNFSAKLPESQAKVAQEILRDPYNFDFLSLRAGFHERELEEGLVEQIQKTLIEFGHGFAFVGRQYPLEVDGDTYYI